MIQTEFASGVQIAPTPCDTGMVSYRASIALTTAELTLNNIIEMGPLPADCQLVDAILDTDDLDSNGAPTITLDVGIMSGTFGVVDGTRTCDASIMSAVTTAQTGGVVRPTLASAFRIARSSSDVGIGVKIHAAPGTAVAGTLGLTVIYRG